MSTETTNAVTQAARAAALEALTKALAPVLTAISEEAANAAVREIKAQASGGSVPQEVIDAIEAAASAVESAEAEVAEIKSKVEDWEYQASNLNDAIDSWTVADAEGAVEEATVKVGEARQRLGL
jgi:membrane-bound lytic murein transglycosylase B